MAQRAQVRRRRVQALPGRRRGLAGSLAVHGLLAGGLAWAVQAALTPVLTEPAPALPPMVFAPAPVLPVEREVLPPVRSEDVPTVDVTAEAAEVASKDTVELPQVVPAPMVAQSVPLADAAPVLSGRAPDAGLCQLVCAAPRRPRAASSTASSAVVGSTVAPASTASSAGPAVAVSSGGSALAHAGVQVLERVSPVYPRQARRQGLEGVVCLDVTVDDHGHVVTVAVAATSGHALLDAAAREAVCRWRFTPAEGEAERVRITIRFQLT